MIKMSYFNQIDTDAKAYLLGTITYLNPVKIYGIIHQNTRENYDGLFDIADENHNLTCLIIKDRECIKDIYKLFNVQPDGQEVTKYICNIPESITDLQLLKCFIRGRIDAHYSNSSFEFDEHNSLKIGFFCDQDTANKVMKITNIVTRYNYNLLTFTGVNAVDLLGFIYDKSDCKLRNSKNFDCYVDMLGHIHNILCVKTTPEAIIPFKYRTSDIGYDLTIIKEDKKLGEHTILYDSCIKLNPPLGYYVEVVPRSSLSKSGYMLANSIGIIDQSYRGTIKVALTKIDHTKPDLTLPFVGAQLIVRKAEHAIFTETNELDITERNEKGFGSTNYIMNKP